MSLIVRTPDVIAAEINSIKDQTKKVVLSASVEIGRRLIEAKEMLNHGEWGTWLQDNVDYSQRNANNLMKLFNEYGSDQINLLGDNLKSQAFANLSYTQAIAMLGIESEEREKFIKDNNVAEMSTRELQKAIKERDEALNLKKELENKLKESTDRVKKIESEKKKIVTDMANSLDKHTFDLDVVKDEKKRAVEALEDAERKIKELEERPIEVNAHAAEEDILKAREEVKRMYQVQLDSLNREKEEAEKRIKELESVKVSKEPQPNIQEVKFRVLFSELQESFNKVISELGNLEDRDKYAGAVRKLIKIMEDKVNE
ncbi:MAG: DUF3102 domain-containing protein [Clostridium sp.]